MSHSHREDYQDQQSNNPLGLLPKSCVKHRYILKKFGQNIDLVGPKRATNGNVSYA